MPNILDLTRYRRCLLIRLATAIGVGLTSGPVVAADNGLKRAERIDLRRLGSVSDAERDVLRIESRVGMSGVDEARRIREMTERLRQMESTVVTVGNALRSLPTERRASIPATVDAAPESSTMDWRLMAANVAALVLVALWWMGRKRAAKAQQEALVKVTRELRGEPILPGGLATARQKIAGDSRTDAFSISQPLVGPEPIGQAEQALAPEPAAEPDLDVLPVLSLPLPDATPAPIPDQALPSATEVPVGEPPGPVIDFVLEEIDPDAQPQAPSPPRKLTGVKSAPPAEEAKRNIEPTLHLAEIMLSMGLEQGAAQALMEYTEANPRDAVYHMLKLLGIYRKRGLHKEFQETAEKLRQHFNIQAEDWNQATGEIPTLEKFTRIAEHVTSIWHQPKDCIDYLKHLLEDNRDGARAGFPQSVAEEILLLVEIQKELSGLDQPAG